MDQSLEQGVRDFKKELGERLNSLMEERKEEFPVIMLLLFYSITSSSPLWIVLHFRLRNASRAHIWTVQITQILLGDPQPLSCPRVFAPGEDELKAGRSDGYDFGFLHIKEEKRSEENKVEEKKTEEEEEKKTRGIIR
ncbi:hypothetical protein JHK87_012566 [Glycine soja]|nr:hypothetical protein JHK87_012566 [Glycine soja]